MNMKAAAFASILALSLAGTACSEKAPAESKTPASAETAANDAPQFNLRYPGSEATTSTDVSSGFNLRTPDSVGSSDGIRLPEGAVNENRLSDVPELDTRVVIEEETPATDPDDDIIRLD